MRSGAAAAVKKRAARWSFLRIRKKNYHKEKQMKIRRYSSADSRALAELFYNTVHSVNARDYTGEQIAVWAPEDRDMTAWDSSFLKHNTLVAEDNGVIIGFADMDETGYLDRLYVHCEHQREGIGTALTAALEDQAKNNGIMHFTVYASITALPFFKKMGYSIICENTVERGGVRMKNYRMEKHIPSNG